MKPISIRYLSGQDFAALELTDHEIRVQPAAPAPWRYRDRTAHAPGCGKTCGGHFNVLRGYIAPTNTAGIKVVGDLHDNYRQGLPSEFGLLDHFSKAALIELSR